MNPSRFDAPPLSAVHPRRWFRPTAFALLGLLAFTAGPSFAATDVLISTGLRTEGAKVTGYKEGTVSYDNSRGEPSIKDALDPKTRKLNERFQLIVPAEPALTAAEQSLADKKYDEAVDGYIRLLSGATPWVRDFAADRLLSLADKVNRPDATVAAWVNSAQRDPNTADKNTPPLPAADSKYLALVTTRVQAGVDSAKSDAAKITLLQYLLKIHTLQKNDAAAAKDLEQLNRFVTATGGGAELAGARMSILLNQARQDLDKKNYKVALDHVVQNKANFNDPSQQGDALWIIAASKEGLAGDPKDAATLQDLALDYMRLVANFPSNDNAADALYRTAMLLEKAGDKAGAVELYRQITAQYKDRPAAQEAQKALQRLGVAAPSGPVTAVGGGQ